MNLSDLQTKKVISVLTGKNLGIIVDAKIKQDGTIDSLMIEQNRNVFSLNKENNTKILWSDISKIGEDVILVKKE